MLKTTLIVLFPIISFAQIVSEKKSYKSECGKTFAVGDTVKLGIGTQGSRKFAFVYHITASTKINDLVLNSAFGLNDGLSKDYSLRKIVIQDFEEKKDRVYAVFEKSLLGRKLIEIETAIATKEIMVECK